MQFTLLFKMASDSFDWPLDEAAKNSGALPRIYKRGWLAMARKLGMTFPDSLDEIEVIDDEPRAPKKELKAMQRLSLTAKKLEAAGLIKCLRKGSPQKRNNAIWLLTIGTPDENREVEAYVRQRLHIWGEPCGGTVGAPMPQPDDGLVSHTRPSVPTFCPHLSGNCSDLQ